jgi:hypothetical protein
MQDPGNFARISFVHGRLATSLYLFPEKPPNAQDVVKRVSKYYEEPFRLPRYQVVSLTGRGYRSA